MRTFKVKVTQVCRVTRETVVEVEVPDDEGVESAVERVLSGDFDLPNADDSVWTAGWDLMHEEAEPA